MTVQLMETVTIATSVKLNKIDTKASVGINQTNYSPRMDSDLQHNCRLPFPEDDILKQTINTGVFIQTRRKWYKFCMISKRHPLTSLYFNSIDARKKEELKHLVHNIHVIHPLSLFALYWEISILWVYVYGFITQAVSSAYLFRFTSDAFRHVRAVGNLILVADIVKMFVTGVYDKELNKTIFHVSEIAKRYATFYFWVDLLSVTHLVTVVLEEVQFDDTFEDVTTTVTRFLGLVKIMQLKRLLHALELFRQWRDYSSYRYKMFTVTLLYVIILCWLFSLGLLVENLVSKYYQEKVPSVQDMFLSITMMLVLASYGEMPVTETHQFIIVVVFINIGFVLHLLLYAQLMQVFNKFTNARNKNEKLYHQFKEYSKYKLLPVELQSRIFRFFNFRYQNKFFNARWIQSIISSGLKEDILLHVIKAHIEKVDIFDGLPQQLLMKVVSKLRTEIYLPDDVIVNAGSPGTCMYFIYFGTVAVFTPTGKELCHLEDGAHFGEIALVFTEKRVATVIAVTPCELFKLKRSDFIAAMQPFPKLKAKISQTARLRMVESRTEY